MFNLHRKVDETLSHLDEWRMSSKLGILAAIFMFFAIPITVLALFNSGPFTSQAASGKPTSLATTVGITPRFSWQCSCFTSKYRIYLREGDNKFWSGQYWYKDVAVDGLTFNLNIPFGSWGSNGYKAAPISLKYSTTYYWAVGCITGGCKTSDIASFTTIASPVTLDTEHDGFSDSLEGYIGTNPFLMCGYNNWPPDFNGDGIVNSLDLQAISRKLSTTNIDRRFDLNADGLVNTADQIVVANYYGRICFKDFEKKPG